MTQRTARNTLLAGFVQNRLRAARDAVNAETFGTDVWEAKMAIVRQLADEANAAAPKFAHTSIDGDIFNGR